MFYIIGYCIGVIIVLVGIYLWDERAAPIPAAILAAAWPFTMPIALALGWAIVMLSIAINIARALRWARHKLLR